MSGKVGLKQRADLTYKHNRDLGRHGWLRLTPAYSVKLVTDAIASSGTSTRVLDPFSGTATTTTCAAFAGHEAVSFDINPFLIWFGNAKVRRYTPEHIADAAKLAAECARMAQVDGSPAHAPPPIHNIERWWDQHALTFLCSVKATIATELPLKGPVHDLLQVIFCRTLIEVSNAAFNHQSMSFKDKKGSTSSTAQGTLFEHSAAHAEKWMTNSRLVLSAAAQNPKADAKVLLADSRSLEVMHDKVGGLFDLLVSSPPYPNRMSYIRELRPYMYWLDFLHEAKEAGELDWKAIGGTWGIATSRLMEWKPREDVPLPDYLLEATAQVEKSHDKNGHLLANYIGKYFEDMALHFRGVRRLLREGARAHYIIGNSTFYGVMIPAERIYADQMRSAGFGDLKIEAIRKRNSKKELVEFDVSGTAV